MSTSVAVLTPLIMERTKLANQILQVQATIDLFVIVDGTDTQGDGRVTIGGKERTVFDLSKLKTQAVNRLTLDWQSRIDVIDAQLLTVTTGITFP